MNFSSLLFGVLAVYLCSGESHKAVRSLATGFVRGVSGVEATVPASCFDLETTIDLEDSLINTLGAFIRGNDLFDVSVSVFKYKVRKAAERCRLDTNFHSMGMWNSTSKVGKVVLSLVLYLEDCMNDLYKAGEAAVKYDWATCGLYLGRVAKTVTQTTPSHYFILPGLKSFLKGLISGLAKNPESVESCAEEVLRMSKYFGPFIEIVFEIVFDDDSSQLDWFALPLVAGATEVVRICRLKSLQQTASDRLNSGELLTNTIKNAEALGKLLSAMDSECVGEWEDCGKSIGKALKLVLGWEL